VTDPVLGVSSPSDASPRSRRRSHRRWKSKAPPRSRNVQQASAGTTQVASNITDVSRGAAETGSAPSQVLSSAKSLANESSRLKLEMSKFLVTVCAA
jgi:hypothetical protein